MLQHAAEPHATFGERAEDVFYVTDAQGGALTEGARKRLTVLALALDPSIAHNVDIVERPAGKKRA